MTYLSDQIGEYLGSAVDGLAYSETSDEGNVFVDHLPSGPDRCVAVFTTPGPEPSSKLPYDPATFQVIARCEVGSGWATTMLDAVYDELHAKRNATLPGGARVMWILATQASPFRLQDDDNGRPRYSVNYRTEILRTTKERTE